MGHRRNGRQQQGLSRRDFLRTGSGMAAAFVALNQVFGPCYDVEADEATDPEKVREKWPKDQFIFDVQTHHVDVSRQVVRRHAARAAGSRTSSACCGRRPSHRQEPRAAQPRSLRQGGLRRQRHGHGVISGVPTRDWDKNPLPPDQMVATRKYVNDLAGSQRVLSHGLLRPNLGKQELDEMERQVKELKIDAWKMYTGAELGEKAWFLDDEKVAYPFWERTKKLGVKNLCVHKGLPLGVFNEKACTPLDLEKAARDWPDLNFIVYHSGFRGLGRREAGRKQTRRRFPGSATSSASSRTTPGVKNIYFELGSTFDQLSSFAPETLPAHARPDDPGGRRRPHPLGHRLHLGRQPAEPDRAPAPAEDEGRADREVQVPSS